MSAGICFAMIDAPSSNSDRVDDAGASLSGSRADVEKRRERATYETGETILSEPAYKHHFELLDRYQAFSAEVVRLSLLSIGAVGFFLSAKTGIAESIAWAMVDSRPRPLTMGALAAFTLAGALGLLHRYVSSDVMYYLLRAFRRPLKEEEVKARDRMFDWSERTIIGAPLCLALGVAMLAIAFVAASTNLPAPSPAPQSIPMAAAAHSNAGHARIPRPSSSADTH